MLLTTEVEEEDRQGGQAINTKRTHNQIIEQTSSID